MKTALVTGASRGIGRALAEKFLNEGFLVIGTSTSGETNFTHDQLSILQLDLSDPASIECCAKEIRNLTKEIGKIDILVNNAGMAIEEEAEKEGISIEYLRKTLEVNLIGTIDLTERVVDLVREGGHILNVSSRAGSLGHTGYMLNYPAYSISKTGLNMFTKLLAKRLSGNATVSSVHPGWVQTDMGGEDADITPKEAADDLYALATSNIESGKFWFKNEPFSW